MTSAPPERRRGSRSARQELPLTRNDLPATAITLETARIIISGQLLGLVGTVPAHLSGPAADRWLARELVKLIAGHCWDGKNDMVCRVHAVLADLFPRWTNRRVRAIWHRETALIHHYEMVELAVTALMEAAGREVAQ